LISDLRRRRPLRHECQLEVVDLALFPIPVADLAFLFIEGEAFQGRDRITSP
jgi:hypothetical protein